MQPNSVEIVPQAHSGGRAATRTELERFEVTLTLKNIELTRAPTSQERYVVQRLRERDTDS